MRKLLCAVLAVLLLVGTLPASAMALDTVTREYEDQSFSKISNPTAGPGTPDGINTNDITGYAANRLNSYAWAVASRGDYIYIGTNRNLFGSAFNALGEHLRKQNPTLSQDKLNILLGLFSGGDVPMDNSEESYIPQIIRFDVENGTTKVIYQPDTVRGADEVLYYADKDGILIPESDVVSEAASFRSVIEYQGNLYFGSLGTNMLQLVRVDAEDNAEIVYQNLGISNSLRACCVYGEGIEETLYFGGQDTSYAPWLAYRQSNPDSTVCPLVIRFLDPLTAGTDDEDWSGLVADFRDFGKYADANAYRLTGGNLWDLCSFNGKLYVILANDSGWVMFRGEKVPGDPAANSFGWKWTEIVGDDGAYPAAMDAKIALKNKQLEEDYNCIEYAPTLYGAGLLESTATPFVFNGKMYIGTFDNSTSIQSQTMTKMVVKLAHLLKSDDAGDTGPTLTQIFAPIYEVLSNPQRIWVMDENETITAVSGANALLKDTTNDYVWRFAEYDGKLYAGTFDAASSYSYYLNLFTGEQRDALKEFGLLPDDLLAELDGSNIQRLQELIDELDLDKMDLDENTKTMLIVADLACELLYSVLQDGTSVEELLETMEMLKTFYSMFTMMSPDSIPEETAEKIEWLLNAVDVEGLQYWAKARTLVNEAESGFDLLVSEDGENWEAIVRDGFGDSGNYGARTLTVHQGELYIGTANPFYGAQLWKMTDVTPIDLPDTVELTAGDILPDFLNRGKAQSDDPSVAWVDSEGALKALKAGTTVIYAGGDSCTVTVKPYDDGSEIVGQLKLLARYNDTMSFYDGHVYLLFTSYKDDVTIQVDDLYAGYEISDLYYDDIAKDISYGSNRNKATTVDDYFTFRDGMTSGNGMNSVTLDRGEIVTIGMYRDFDYTVADAAVGTLKNSSMWTGLSESAKTALVTSFFDFLENVSVSSFASLADLLKQTAAEGFDYRKLLDGVVDGGVSFNRELYNQKLEWDQYENVTYELDITENQLAAMIQALQGNLNKFSFLKNSCATVALRVWNAAVGTRGGADTAYNLSPTGKGIYALIDAPKTVKNEIINKLPGYYLNNAEGVAEPDAGYQDNSGWVYVSVPEALPGGAASPAADRLVISVTGTDAKAETRAYYLDGEGQEVPLALSQYHTLPAGKTIYVKTAPDATENHYLLSDITLNGASILADYDTVQGAYTATMPDGNARINIVYEMGVVYTKRANQLQIASGDSVNVSDCAYLALGEWPKSDVVWKVLDGDINVSADGKTLTAGAPGTAVVWAQAAGNENIGVLFTVEILESLAGKAKVTFNEDERYTITADGTAIPFSGYMVDIGSVLTVKAEQQTAEAISLFTANDQPVLPGNSITLAEDTDIRVQFRAAEIRNMPATIRLDKKGDTYALQPRVQYSGLGASALTVYDPSITFETASDLISVDQSGLITVTGTVPEDGALAIVTAVAGSSNRKVIATAKVVLGDFEAERPVGRLTLSGRYINPGEFIAHGCLTFVSYEDVDLDISYYNYYEPTQAYIDLLEDYRDHPEKYDSDPALYNESLEIEDRESYFITHTNGAGSEAETIHLRPGEGLTFSNYGFDATNVVALRKALESEKLASSQAVQALIEQLKLYCDGAEIDGPLAFDSLLASLVQIYAITKATGENPADAHSDGGLNVNREIFNQFRRNDTQLPNNYYTIEITAEQLAYLESYLSDPENNYYSLFTMNCGSAVAYMWNQTLFDRPDLQLTANYTGFTTEPESLSIELFMLRQKTGLTYTGTGEGGGTNFRPQIAPGWYKDVTITPISTYKYVGEADPKLSATIEGLPEGKKLNYTLKRVPGETAGTYAISVVLMENPGFRITVNQGTFTIYAQAENDYKVQTYFDVNLPSDESAAALHGSVSSSAERARAGEEITLTLRPDEGYTASGVTVTDAYGDPVDAAENEDGTWSFVMPAAAVDVEPVFTKAATSIDSVSDCPKSSDCPISHLSDTGTDTWYHDGVHWALENKIMNGTSETTFEPNGTATRAMVVTMLWRLAGEPESDSIASFTDVKAGSWYADAVNWASEIGIVKGTSETKFSPSAPVTREQLAAILYRYAQSQGKGFTGVWAFELEFSDANTVSDYAYEAICWMTMHGVIQGMGNGTLAPRANATRAQIATMFMRFAAEMEK